MRFLLSLTLLFLFFSVSFASPRHVASGRPSIWKQLTRASDSHRVKAAFAIKQQNLDLLSNVLDAVSDPKSPLYGNYLSYDEVNKLTANTKGAKEVAKYLLENGVNSVEITDSHNFVKATLTAKQAEELLKAPVYHFAHQESDKTIQRALSYEVPDEIEQHVDFIGYLSHFPTMHRMGLRSFATPDVNKAGDSYPSLLNKVYSIDSNTVVTTEATQSCFEAGQFIQNSDLNKFQSLYGLPQQNLSAIIGPNTPSKCSDLNNCVESTLDFEYIMAIAQGAPTSYIAVAETDSQPFLDYLLTLSNDVTPPLVNSISYGEVEQDGDKTEINSFNTEAQKLGVRGVTIVVASGDDGVANYPARDSLSKCGFYPSFPASSPYVVAVGATQGPEAGSAEIAETSNAGGGITTGGGFSTVYTQPSYQTSFVQSFLNSSKVLPPSSQYNAKGRGYPDVALLGHNYEIVDNGQSVAGSGTSASAPVFAGMLSLINAERIKAGKAPLGFVNPALYSVALSTPDVFNDITQGENNCVAGDGKSCCTYGFTAQKGWDPTTGLGSVNFQKLKKALLAL